MTVRITAQKDYYLTEASVDRETPIADLDRIMKDLGASGKMVVLYNGGAVQGINVEQRTKITDAQSEKLRPLLNIDTKEVEVKVAPRK